MKSNKDTSEKIQSYLDKKKSSSSKNETPETLEDYKALVEELQKRMSELEAKNEELNILAFTDKLTDCYNTNWWICNVPKDYKTNLSVVDINRLKFINDHFGHEAGNKLIKNVAETLKQYGTVVRYGGDEFLVLSDKEEDFLELNTLETEKFSCAGATIGEYDTIEEAIQLADKRMYERKAQFRMEHENDFGL